MPYIFIIFFDYIQNVPINIYMPLQNIEHHKSENKTIYDALYIAFLQLLI